MLIYGLCPLSWDETLSDTVVAVDDRLKDDLLLLCLLERAGGSIGAPSDFIFLNRLKNEAIFFL